MFNSLISSTLYMKMDIYESTLTQDEITKALKRQWLYKKTAQCLARGYVSETSKTSGSGERSVRDIKIWIILLLRPKSD
jgi:hypothetical protein